MKTTHPFLASNQLTFNFTTPHKLLRAIRRSAFFVVLCLCATIKVNSQTIQLITDKSDFGNGNSILCHGGNSGSISVSIIGADSLTLALSQNGNIIDSSFVTTLPHNWASLSAGDYVVSGYILDSLVGIDSLTLYQPGVFALSSVSVTPESCNPGSDGSVEFSLSGGTTPYTFEWSGISSPPSQGGVGGGFNFDSLNTGTYYLNVTDDNGCVALDTFTISNANSISLALHTNELTPFDYHISCTNSGGDGIVWASSTGGNGSKTYAWVAKRLNRSIEISAFGQIDTTETRTTDYISNVDSLSFQSAGTYICTVTDASGCKATDSVSLSSAVDFYKNIALRFNPEYTEGSGLWAIKAKATLAGGIPPYSYFGVESGADSITLYIDSTYTIGSKDATHCYDDGDFSEPVVLSHELYLMICEFSGGNCGGGPTGTVNITGLSPGNLSAFGASDGSLTAYISGDCEDISASLYLGAASGSPLASVAVSGGEANFESLAAGNYVLVAYGCDSSITDTTIFTLTQPDSIPAIPAWGLHGNSGMDSTMYLGTSDSTDFVLKSNGKVQLRLKKEGGVEVNGNMKMMAQVKIPNINEDNSSPSSLLRIKSDGTLIKSTSNAVAATAISAGVLTINSEEFAPILATDLNFWGTGNNATGGNVYVDPDPSCETCPIIDPCDAIDPANPGNGNNIMSDWQFSSYTNNNYSYLARWVDDCINVGIHTSTPRAAFENKGQTRLSNTGINCQPITGANLAIKNGNNIGLLIDGTNNAALNMFPNFISRTRNTASTPAAQFSCGETMPGVGGGSASTSNNESNIIQVFPRIDFDYQPEISKTGDMGILFKNLVASAGHEDIGLTIAPKQSTLGGIRINSIGKIGALSKNPIADFQVLDGISSVGIGGSAMLTNIWNTGYIGFNVNWDGNNWIKGGDANSGAVAMVADVGGGLTIFQKHTGSTNTSFTNGDFIKRENTAFKIDGSGRVSVGSQTNGYKTQSTGFWNAELQVNGTIVANKVKVTLNDWADFVFDKNYKLNSLDYVEKYIKENHHLPNIPNAQEVDESGIDLGEMNKLLLQKVEELTLYVIELKKQNEKMESLISKISSR